MYTLLLYGLIAAAVVTGVVYEVEHLREQGRTEQKSKDDAFRAQQDVATAKKLAKDNQEIIDDADTTAKAREALLKSEREKSAGLLAKFGKLDKKSVAWLDTPVDPVVRGLRHVRYGDTSPLARTGLVLRPDQGTTAQPAAAVERQAEPRPATGSGRLEGRADPVQPGESRRAEIVDKAERAEESILARLKAVHQQGVNP